MSIVHRLARRVRGQHVSAWLDGGRRLPRERAPDRQLLDLPAYRQLDDHSCGFVAALTVARYFDPAVSPEDVLHAVRPPPRWGGGQRGLPAALRRFGVTAAYREGLGQGDLFRLADRGVPVVVTVWLDEEG